MEKTSLSTKKVIEEILLERERHAKIGFTPEHDDLHVRGTLSGAAACYAINAAWLLNPETEKTQLEGVPVWWTLESEQWKPKTSRKDLVRAASLIIAEIECIDRDDEKKVKASQL